jgi:hypothetical protein
MTCRTRTSGNRAHRCSRAHWELVESYRLWRETELLAAEAATNGYETELAEYWQTHTRPTFRAYLIGVGRTAR